MKYIKIKWIHTFDDEPVWLYSELDDEGRETRKVEVFPDQTIGFASSTEKTEKTFLAFEPLPSVDEIAADPQFEPEEISRLEFKEIWARRHD